MCRVMLMMHYSYVDVDQCLTSLYGRTKYFLAPHILLHFDVAKNLRDVCLDFASRYVGVKLIGKFIEKKINFLGDLLGGPGRVMFHLFECYMHYIFEQGPDIDLEHAHWKVCYHT